MGLIKPKESGGGGIVLPTLTDPAQVTNVEYGKEYIDDAGAKQSGTLGTLTAGQLFDLTYKSDTTNKLVLGMPFTEKWVVNPLQECNIGKAYLASKIGLTAGKIATGNNILGIDGSYSGPPAPVPKSYEIKTKNVSQIPISPQIVSTQYQNITIDVDLSLYLDSGYIFDTLYGSKASTQAWQDGHIGDLGYSRSLNFQSYSLSGNILSVVVGGCSTSVPVYNYQLNLFIQEWKPIY